MKEKYEALKELEKAAFNKSVAEKYMVPKNTLRIQTKIFDDFQARNPKRRKARGGNHENLDKAMFQWFLSVRSQDVPIGGAVFKGKAKFYAKDAGFYDFQASDGWICRWKERYSVTFKKILVKQVQSLQKW